MPASGTFSEGLARVFAIRSPWRTGHQDHHGANCGGKSAAARRRVASGMLNSIGIQAKGVPHFSSRSCRSSRILDAACGQHFGADGEQFAEPRAELNLPAIAASRRTSPVPTSRKTARRSPCSEVDGRRRRAAARKPQLPLWVKLTPNTGDVRGGASRAEANGADALVVANTILSMSIDTETFKPRLGNIMGGYSGPADQADRLAHGLSMRQSGRHIP